MNSRIYSILLYLLTATSLLGQTDYFNQIIPFEFGNPNVIQMIEFNHSLLIDCIYLTSGENDQSTLIEINQNQNKEYHHYTNIVYSPRTLTQSEDKFLYTYGKNRNNDKDIRLMKLDTLYNVIWNKQIHTIGNKNYPIASALINDRIYLSYIYTESDKYKFGLNCVNLDGEELWSKQYENNFKNSYHSNMIPSNDGNVFYGFSLTYTDQYEDYAYVQKIDSTGEIIWKTMPLGLISFNDVRIHITELSNGNIVVNFRKDMWDVYEYWCCYVPYTPTFILLDPDGNILDEHILKQERDTYVTYWGLKAGNDDYYFSYGEHRLDVEDSSDSDYYGFITKHTNEGDTIWSRYYRHQLYDQVNTFHQVEDIIELDNGDIIAMGSIAEFNAKSNIWYFKINADGCFPSSDCSDDNVQIFTSTHDILNDKYQSIILYPNPTTDELFIQSDMEITRVTITDVSGLTHIDRLSTSTIDLESLANGLYFIRIQTADGYHCVKQFVKN